MRSVPWTGMKLHMDKPAVIIELKWDKAAINYDKKSKQHTCVIEKVSKEN